jgi:hypothetical protein
VILDMPPKQYRALVEWSALQVLADRVETPSNELEAVLRDWQVDPAHWVQAIKHFDSWFRHAVGGLPKLIEFVARKGQKWVHGIEHCRNLFLAESDRADFPIGAACVRRQK